MLRRYRPDDLDACRRMWEELTDWHRHIYAAPHIGGADPGRQFDEHLARVGPANLWVWEDEGTVVGLAGLIEGDGEYELEPVVVAAGHRGRGIGRRLVEAVVAAAESRGAGSVSVRPVARNSAAVGFFAALGFGTIGHVELIRDLRPAADRWVDGEELAGRRFRI